MNPSDRITTILALSHIRSALDKDALKPGALRYLMNSVAAQNSSDQVEGREEYVLEAVLRRSGDEWFLQISGGIGDTYLSCIHRVDGKIPAEDVPGLDHLYRELRELRGNR